MIYLDNAATSFPKPPEVIRAMAGVEEKMGANHKPCEDSGSFLIQEL